MLDLFEYTNDNCECPPMIPVDRGIRIPENRVQFQKFDWDNLRGRLHLDRLAVGDSIALRPEWFEGIDIQRLANWLSGAGCSYRKTQPSGTWACTTRQMPDGSVRLWRIKPEEAKTRGQ